MTRQKYETPIRVTCFTAFSQISTLLPYRKWVTSEISDVEDKIRRDDAALFVLPHSIDRVSTEGR